MKISGSSEDVVNIMEPFGCCESSSEVLHCDPQPYGPIGLMQIPPKDTPELVAQGHYLFPAGQRI